MNHNEAYDLLIDYYNDQLAPEEKAAFEQHLKTCEACQEELAEWEALNAELIDTIPLVDPPEGMKDRVLGNVFFEEATEQKQKVQPIKKGHRSFKIPFIAAAAALLLSVLGNVYMLAGREETADLAEVLLQEESAISLSPTSETLDMDAKVALHEGEDGQTLVLEASNFTNLNEDEVYQVWLMKEGNPYRAGTLVPNEEGQGYVVFNMDENTEIDWDTVAITVEPSPHNQLPEGDIVMSAEL
ncbi:anti-sigma factor [Salinicoccus sp. ID82-1]|uniref:anti-sigma factor n=1 Tax=Salinicoccus sp. ID82-1 TaxID=2820269 RepID=UPI001F021070|nr:anti-sigma factor [Salinicoccus sp. ID82-1]MCG1008515.1 anti-sigma factor [Salinicoccus sp. ID82-1]